MSIIAGNIKGITISIGGETTGLQKALADVNKKTRDVQSELKQVERLLKLDPKNTDLLAQRQKLLAEAVENSREKLDRLKTAQEQVNEQFRKGEINEEQYRAFQREVVKAEQDLKKFETQLKSTGMTAEQLGQKIQGIGQKMTDMGKNLSMKVTAPIAAAGAGVVKLGMDFEAAMSEVGAISGATGDDLKALEDKAKELGAATKFSSSEAAEGLKYMAMAGWDVQQQLDGLPGVLKLAASSGEDLGTVSDIVTDAMTAFGMEAKRAGEFADTLAAASANSNTNVGLLGESFKHTAPVAGALGFAAKDTSVALGLMANAGIKGSQAGTSLRTMMTNLAKPTKQMQDAMNQYGISLTHTDGSMKSLDEVMLNLRSSLGGLTEAEQAAAAATIFGKEAMSGALAIVNTSEADYNKLSESINNSTGAADRMSKAMQDNLKGRLEELTSAIEGVALQLYDAMQPALEKVVAAVQKLVDWFAKLSPSMQTVIVVIAGLAAAIGPLLIILGMMAQGMGAVIGVVGTLSGALPVLGAVFTALTGPIGLVVAAIAALIAIGVLLWQNWEEISAKAVEIWTGISEFFIQILTSIQEFIAATWEAIQMVFSTTLEAITSVLTTTWETISTITSEVWEGIQQLLSTVWEAIQMVFSTALEAITSVLTTAWETIASITSTIWEGVQQLLSTIWEGIQLVFSTALEAITSVLTTAWETIDNITSEVWEGIKTFLSEAWENIKTDIGTKTEEIKANISQKWEEINSNTDTQWRGIESALADIWGNIKATADSIWQGIADSVKGSINGITAIINKWIGFINSIKIEVPRIEIPFVGTFGGWTVRLPRIPEIPALAKGGIVTKEMLAMVGEAGPEAVIPLKELKKMITELVGDAQHSKHSNGDIYQTIQVHSPTPLTPAETARQVKNASRLLALEW